MWIVQGIDNHCLNHSLHRYPWLQYQKGGIYGDLPLILLPPVIYIIATLTTCIYNLISFSFLIARRKRFYVNQCSLDFHQTKLFVVKSCSLFNGISFHGLLNKHFTITSMTTHTTTTSSYLYNCCINNWLSVDVSLRHIAKSMY